MEMQTMSKIKIVCQVCGRPPGGFDSLCFGVHANCGHDLTITSVLLPELHKVTGGSGKVWYCDDNGTNVVEDPKKWLKLRLKHAVQNLLKTEG